MAEDQPSTADAQVQVSLRECSDLHPWLSGRFLWKKFFSSTTLTATPRQSPSPAAGSASLPGAEKDVENTGGPETMLYLAYGSNLSAETFLGKRGIKPISQMNVLVPELALSFDLPGIPYAEPCFANTRRRRSESSSDRDHSDSEKSPLMTDYTRPDYHKDRWHKGLVGVVYEVTKEDYATIIATEGGGAAYHDILVTCHSLPDAPTVPEQPETPPFKAHTLFAQKTDSQTPDPTIARVDRLHRPDPSYAQASARYLKLITDGAEQHRLPREYLTFLYDIRPYTITQNGQRLGQFIFLGLWMPLLTLIFGAGSIFADKNGKFPPWFAEFTAAVFKAVWGSYDGFFRNLFGDGERTVGQDGESDGDR